MSPTRKHGNKYPNQQPLFLCRKQSVWGQHGDFFSNPVFVPLI